MMRIAIAGAGGLGYVLAQQISQGAHALLVLSTREHPEYQENLGVQVAVVDYSDVENLRYTLQGVDLLISTIGGNEQLDLIDGARRARVRTFVPSEFEGDLAHRPDGNDTLDRGTSNVLDLLRRWAQSKTHKMQYTVFSCGVFMERFAYGGLASFNIGHSQPGGTPAQGDYLVDIGLASAEIVDTNASGRSAHVSMTSVYDLARFMAAAIELGLSNWPQEYRMRGDNLTPREIVQACKDVRRVPFTLVSHPYGNIESHLNYYEQAGDYARWMYFQRLQATAQGRYNMRDTNLNTAVNRSSAVNVQPLTFRRWLEQNWGPAEE